MSDVNINVACHYLEKAANIGACVPVYGTSIIVGRFVGGLAQTVLGVFTRIIGWLVETLIDRGHLKNWERKKWQEISEIGAEHTKHGLLNVGVAISQFIIGYFTFNLGNVFVHYYFKSHFNFDPFVHYKGIMPANSYTKTHLLVTSKNYSEVRTARKW